LPEITYAPVHSVEGLPVCGVLVSTVLTGCLPFITFRCQVPRRILVADAFDAAPADYDPAPRVPSFGQLAFN